MNALALPTTNAQFELDYLTIMDAFIKEGNIKTDRTGTGTLSKFANMQRVDISDGKAPLLYSKEVKTDKFITETVWFKDGGTDVAFLKKYGVGIWDEWVIPETAVFRDYTEAEIANYWKQYCLSYEIQKDTVMPEGACVMSYKDMFNWVRCTRPEAYKEWRAAHGTEQNLFTLSAFCKNNNVPLLNKRLIGGNIGPAAYGALWRNWEDTRIVPKKDEQKYYDRGYAYVADVPMGSNYGKKNGVAVEYVVVHRNIDQLANVIKQLRTDPMGRRIIVSAWNPGRTEDAVLPPCHTLFSFYVRDMTVVEMEAQINAEGAGVLAAWWNYRTENLGHIKLVRDDAEAQEYRAGMAAFCKTLPMYKLKTQTLSCFLYMRSNDFALGNPFNVPQYALLTQMVAQVVGMATDELVVVAADSHLYANHVEPAMEQLARAVETSQQPRFLLDPNITEIDDFTVESIKVVNYSKHAEPISYPIAV